MPTLLHEFFDQAAQRWPTRPAVDVPPGVGRPERRVVTYAELRHQSDVLAGQLRSFVAGECVVAILLPRASEHLYVAQLAVLKAGAAHACLDPAFPDEQIRDVLEDAEALALLTNAAGRERAHHAGWPVERVVDVATQSAPAAAPVALPPPPWLTPRSLAYLIYTSGTTGRPKGVMIEHSSICNLVQTNLEDLDLGPGDRVGQGSSPAYDSSVEETWLALSAGATLVVMDDDTTHLGPDLVPWLCRERITMLCPPPTLLRTTGCDNPATVLPELRLLYVGGEALPRDVADRWARGRRLINGYGPTECTVTALRGMISPGGPITIGRPMRGFQAWVLDDALNEAAEGSQGELCLGGVGLARGYHRAPQLTARKFPLHPRLGRIYRTGDLVHRAADGSFFYHGRIDTQVKLRGYRIELEAIEARLGEHANVRAAACRVQGDGARQTLVAFVVPADRASGLVLDDLAAHLRAVLPAYMVPSRFGILSELPTTVSGKLNRMQLPMLDAPAPCPNGDPIPLRDEREANLAEGMRSILGLDALPSVHDDFFNVLGGDSLLAAQLISLLRADPPAASLTVRDLYEARTVARLAERVHADGPGEAAIELEPARPGGRPVFATALQSLWLLLYLLVGTALAYAASFYVLPYLLRQVELIPLILLGPPLTLVVGLIYAPFAVGFAVLVKRLLIGRYRPLRAPVWGNFYLRNWIVQQVVRLVPWRLLAGTEFQHMALRALGAKIGRRVHIHRGVNLLQGGWDLLDIGNDVTIGQDAALRLVELDNGQVVVGPITLGNGSTLEVRAGVGGHTCLEEDAYLTALSSLLRGGRILRGERWDGVPAEPAGRSPALAAPAENGCVLSPAVHGLALLLARGLLGMILSLPLQVLAIVFILIHGLHADSAWEWLVGTPIDGWLLPHGLLLMVLAVPFTLAFEAAVLRALGHLPPGVISRWSLTYVRVWLKTGVVEAAGEWLSGTLLWPVWLRWAGMKVGRGCEISSIIDVVPELITIGSETFLADGIYLGGPQVHRGSVTLAPVQLGRNTFLGNHVVIRAGQHLPEDVLLGVCTVANDQAIRAGTSWFGHPPFELPRREVIACDRRLTHAPSPIRYGNRVFWEWLRFALPVIPVCTLLAWFRVVAAAHETASWPTVLGCVVPLASAAATAFLCLVVLALKWCLLGRVRPGVHPLWSCWCSRWDFLYVAWGMYAHAILSAFEGTLLLPWYLRAMGSRVGRGVVLGGGFAQVVDPDMLDLQDGATVTCMFQAHTFEDRVLKIDRVTIRRGATVGGAAVLLYGADIGERAWVAPHSVVMKRERLLPGRAYAGCPTRPKTRRPIGESRRPV